MARPDTRAPHPGGAIDLGPSAVRRALASALRDRGPDATLAEVHAAAARLLDPEGGTDPAGHDGRCRPEMLRAVRREMLAALDRAFGPQTCAAAESGPDPPDELAERERLRPRRRGRCGQRDPPPHHFLEQCPLLAR